MYIIDWEPPDKPIEYEDHSDAYLDLKQETNSWPQNVPWYMVPFWLLLCAILWIILTPVILILIGCGKLKDK